jgi:hypothetical protein
MFYFSVAAGHIFKNTVLTTKVKAFFLGCMVKALWREH